MQLACTNKAAKTEHSNPRKTLVHTETPTWKEFCTQCRKKFDYCPSAPTKRHLGQSGLGESRQQGLMKLQTAVERWWHVMKSIDSCDSWSMGAMVKWWNQSACIGVGCASWSAGSGMDCVIRSWSEEGRDSEEMKSQQLVGGKTGKSVGGWEEWLWLR